MDSWIGAETCKALHHCTWSFLFLYIKVQRMVQPKKNLKDYAWETVLKGGRWVQMRCGQCHAPSQSPTCVLCSLEIPVWYPLQELGWQFICAQLNKGGLNSASLFSEASTALAWLAEMFGNLASNCVNWLVCWVFIWMSIWTEIN